MNGARIQASTTLTVNNLSGGTIYGRRFGIFANSAATVVVTNAAGGRSAVEALVSRFGLRHGDERGHDLRRNELSGFYPRAAPIR